MESSTRQVSAPVPARRRVICLAVVFLLLAGLRLPALTGFINLSHDATEYIDIARNFASGEGLVLKIRGYFFGDSFTLPYPAPTLRSPLFPVLTGSVYAVVASNHVFQWFNFALFIVNMALLLQILRPILPFWLIAYSLLLIGLSEPMFLTSLFPWAEQTALFWLLAAVLMASREIHVRWGPAGAFVEGLVSAMASMSRPEYVLVGALFLVWLALQGKRRKLLCGAFVAGLLIPLAGLSAIYLREFGRLFLPGEYLFRSRHYAAFFSWESGNEGGAGSFLAANWLWIIKQIGLNVVNYLAKLVGWKNLFFLSVALPSAVWNGLRAGNDWRRQHLVVVSGVFLCGYCMIWAGMDRERYLLAVTTFFLPVCLLEVNRWRLEARRKWTRIVCITLMAANLPFFLARTVAADVAIRHRTRLGERFYARENPAWSNPDLDRLAVWVRRHVQTDDVLCLENPFLLNYETGCLAVVLPERIRPEDFAEFLRFYRVRYWIDNPVYSKWDTQSLSRLRETAWKAGACEVARCGSYRVLEFR